MRLVILGASGGCGRHLTTQAVTAGHEVVAVGRDTSDLPSGDGITHQRGELTDASFLESCFAGADAVLLAVGFRLAGLAPWNKPADPTFLRRCAEATVAAAKATGVGRLMAISAGGVGDSYADMPGAFKMFIRFSSLKHAYPELKVMEDVLLASGLDVCISRPSGLTDEPATGAVVTPNTYRGRAMIPRADVAGWMLEQLSHDPFPLRTPLITVTGG